MTEQIRSNREASCLSEITSDWKIVAYRMERREWSYVGALANGEQRRFRQMAFPLPGDVPLISVVTGRGPDGNEVLYARIFPVGAKPRAVNQSIPRHHVIGGR